MMETPDMKSLKNIHYEVEVFQKERKNVHGFFWKAYASNGTEDETGLETEWMPDGSGEIVFRSPYQGQGFGFRTEKECRDNWKAFAKCNELSFFKFREYTGNEKYRNA